MADLSATIKIETLMVTVCWTEFHIKNNISIQVKAWDFLKKM